MLFWFKQPTTSDFSAFSFRSPWTHALQFLVLVHVLLLASLLSSLCCWPYPTPRFLSHTLLRFLFRPLSFFPSSDYPSGESNFYFCKYSNFDKLNIYNLGAHKMRAQKHINRILYCYIFGSLIDQCFRISIFCYLFLFLFFFIMLANGRDWDDAAAWVMIRWNEFGIKF